MARKHTNDHHAAVQRISAWSRPATTRTTTSRTARRAATITTTSDGPRGASARSGYEPEPAAGYERTARSSSTCTTESPTTPTPDRAWDPSRALERSGLERSSMGDWAAAAAWSRSAPACTRGGGGARMTRGALAMDSVERVFEEGSPLARSQHCAPATTARPAPSASAPRRQPGHHGPGRDEQRGRDASRRLRAGLAFALRGAFDIVATKVFLLSPADVDVSAEESPQAGRDRVLQQS